MTDELAIRVERACRALLTTGDAITFDAVAAHAGIGRATLYRRPELRAIIEQHRHERVSIGLSRGDLVAGLVDRRLLAGLRRVTGLLRQRARVLECRARLGRLRARTADHQLLAVRFAPLVGHGDLHLAREILSGQGSLGSRDGRRADAHRGR